MASQAYSKIFNLLRKQILDGSFAVGQKVPSELEFSEQFGVSRITTRHALHLLQEQGLIERHPGRGTFVRGAKPKKVPILSGDFTGSIRAETPNLQRELLGFDNIVPPAHIRQLLGLLKSERCFFGQRIDILDNEPLAYDRVYIPLNLSFSINEKILKRIDFFETWLATIDITQTYFVDSIEAIDADSEAVKILKVKPKCPMLFATDILYAAGEQAIAVFESVYRGDRFKFVSTGVTEKFSYLKSEL